MATRKKATKKVTKKTATASQTRGANMGNGLNTFSMHSSNKAAAPMFEAVQSEMAEGPRLGFAGAPTIAQLDPETAALRYLHQSLESKSVKGFAVSKAAAPETSFKRLGTETVPLTGTVTVKFRETMNDIPIYGSLVTVELDNDNRLVSLHSAIGEPTGVSPIAKASPADATAAVKKYGDLQKDLENVVPHLHYFYDSEAGKWRLVFILEDVRVKSSKEKGGGIRQRLMDYVVDAQTGKVISELPGSGHLAAVSEDVLDGLSVMRKIVVESSGNKKTLQNNALNVQTFDFTFQDPETQSSRLPGKAITNPPKWTGAAVSAHANACAVADFLRTVLKRNNIDNKGGPMNSSINCLVVQDEEPGKVWRNAFWDGTQMVYGQVQFNGSLLSISVDLDVVAHEMFHGVTDNTSKLQYKQQSGALNESYSDIFGIIVANFGEPNIDKWSWLLGAKLDTGGQPFRDMSDPTRHGQPAFMKNYRNLPVTRNGDYGGVHINSGIHNFAAYKILTAKDSAGKTILTAAEVAAIFYLADTQRLAATSQFVDSRRAVADSALSLFKSQSVPLAQQKAKMGAIDDAFDAVGIKGTRVVVG